MRTWIRRGLIALVALVVIVAAAAALGLVLAERKSNRRIEIAPYAITIPGDAAALERGRYLYASRGCADCHGADGAGRTFVDQGGLLLAGPNITTGPGGVVASYRPSDWERTIRHGVKPDGRPLRVMPSDDYNRLTDPDLGALIAYVKSLAPVRGGAAVVQLPPPVRVLYGFGAIPDPADRIDHTRPPEAPVPEGITAEHGRYVAQMCIGCHGARLEGGRVPGGPPDWPPAARLRAGEGSVMPAYASADTFLAMLKTGKRSDGSAIAVMPFEALRQLSDTDARALHLYLSQLR